MRMIDADALKKTMLNYIDCEKCTHKDTNYCADFCAAYDFLVMLEEAPTIEEKSYAMGYQDGLEDGLNDIRPKGKWELHGKTYYCSECGEEAIDLEPEPDVYSSSYCLTDHCPYCGADMRGKEE